MCVCVCMWNLKVWRSLLCLIVLQIAHSSERSRCLVTINIWRREAEAWSSTEGYSKAHSHVLSGVQARVLSMDEPATLPRHRLASDGQYQNGPDDDPSPDIPVRSPVRCVSPEFVNALAMNPGGRPKEVESRHCSTCVLTFLPPDVDVCAYLIVVLYREICTATGRPSRKWMEAPLVLHPQLVVRCFPKPLPSPSRRKPLTSTCVSSPSGWQRALWSSDLISYSIWSND